MTSHLIQRNDGRVVTPHNYFWTFGSQIRVNAVQKGAYARVLSISVVSPTVVVAGILLVSIPSAIVSAPRTAPSPQRRMRPEYPASVRKHQQLPGRLPHRLCRRARLPRRAASTTRLGVDAWAEKLPLIADHPKLRPLFS